MAILPKSIRSTVLHSDATVSQAFLDEMFEDVHQELLKQRQAEQKAAGVDRPAEVDDRQPRRKTISPSEQNDY